MKGSRKTKEKAERVERAAPRSHRRWLPWAAALLIAGAALAAYVPAFQAGWSWDDDMSVYENPLVTQPDGPRRIWLTTEDHDFWPLTRTAFWLEYQAFGDAPAGYHAVNVVLHALASVLVFLVLSRMGVPAAAFGGLAFALHPVNAATVVWISEFKNILVLIFFALTALAWLRFDESRSRTAYIGAVAAFAAALASKTSVVAWPAMMLGWAWWHRGRLTRRDVIESLPFWALAAAMSAMTFLVQGRIETVLNRPLVGVEKLAGPGWVFWFYAWKALVPVNLSAVYPHWRDTIVSLGWAAYLPTLALAGAVIGSWLARRMAWGRALLLAEGYTLLAMAPVLGVFNSTITMHSLVADHYQYVPIVGIIGLGCAAFSAAARRWPRARSMVAAAGVLIVVGLAPATASRASILSSEERLWNDTLAKNPGAWVAEYNLATGMTLQARRMAAGIVQRSAEVDALAAQAQALQEKGDLAGASSLRDAAGARQREIDAAIAAFKQLGGGAVAHFRRALELQPLYTRTYNNLGLMLGSLGQDEEAIAVYRRGIEVLARHYQREDAGLVFNLSQAFMRQRRFAEAVAAAQDAVRLLPGDPDAQANLAAARAGLRGEGGNPPR